MTAFSRRTWIAKARTPVAICLGSRLALFLLVYLGLVISPDVASPLRPFPANLFLDGWFRWDSGHYFALAQYGYHPVPGLLQQYTNFWPFYPLVVRAASGCFGSPFIAGLMVSNLALLASCVMLHRWVCRRFGQDVATRTITLLLCYPFAFYFSAMYTESVLLFGVVGAFYFSQRSKWLLASLCAAMAGATRLVGIVTIVPVAIAYAEQHSWRVREFRRDVVWLPAGSLGTLGHMLFLHFRFGDGLAFLRSQWVPGWGDNSSWARLCLLLRTTTSWYHLARGSFDAIAAVNLACGGLALLICLLGFRRLGFAAAAWGAITMLISLRIWASAGRYAAVVWPMSLGLALLTRRHPSFYQILMLMMCLAQGLLAFWFAHGHWVA